MTLSQFFSTDVRKSWWSMQLATTPDFAQVLVGRGHVVYTKHSGVTARSFHLSTIDEKFDYNLMQLNTGNMKNMDSRMEWNRIWNELILC